MSQFNTIWIWNGLNCCCCCCEYKNVLVLLLEDWYEMISGTYVLFMWLKTKYWTEIQKSAKIVCCHLTLKREEARQFSTTKNFGWHLVLSILFLVTSRSNEKDINRFEFLMSYKHESKISTDIDEKLFFSFTEWVLTYTNFTSTLLASIFFLIYTLHLNF